MERFKKHSLPTASTLYSIMGAVPGSWVYTMTVDGLEFPSLRQAKTDFESGLALLAKEVHAAL